MVKLLKWQAFSLLVFLLMIFGRQARATHELYIGNEISYVQVSPNTFQVYLTIYQGCIGQQFTWQTLNIMAPGCNNGRTVTMNMLQAVRIAAPYCSSALNICTAGYMNYREIKYAATVVFTPAEMACQDWVLSWSQSTSRHSGQNIANNAIELYGEARLKLLPGMLNSSPKFGFLNSSFVRQNQPAQINSYAIDPDGDSLVYSIQNPLRAYNTPIPYASFPNTILYNADSTKFSPLNGPYSNNFPLISYTIDWTQPMPLFPVKKFSLNTSTGTFSFIPRNYSPSTQLYDIRNNNTIVVQVDEYRKINGVMVKIGTIRRDMLFTVIANSGNNDPEINSVVANGQPITENDVIYLRPGTALNFQFATTDADASDNLTIISDVTDILPGALLNVTSGAKPGATLTWTPTAAHIRDQIYYFHLRVEDNACPVKGSRDLTFGVKVRAAGGVTAAPESLPAAVTFRAFPNPFSEELFFDLNVTKQPSGIVIYNLLGQKIDEISMKTVVVGAQKVPWQRAGKFPAGTYVARLLSADKQMQAIKFTKLQ